MKEYDSAFIETVLAMAGESRRQSKRLFIAVVIEAIVILSMIVCFFVWLANIDFTSSITTTETTTITQDSGTGSGRNVYQAGENATYDEAADKGR